MENLDKRFWFGSIVICLAVLLGSILVSISISRNGRYQFASSTPPGVLWILDTRTGEIKTTYATGKFYGEE